MATCHNQPMSQPRISAIAAISSTTRALGLNNQLLWHLPADLRRFKALTSGHPIIMGRKTYNSIFAYLGKPLPNRTSIVLTRGAPIDHPKVLTARNIEDAITQATATGTDEIFIGGGTMIYELALPYTDRLYLTLVDDEPIADAFFPNYEEAFEEALREKCSTEPQATFITFDRVSKKAAS